MEMWNWLMECYKDGSLTLEDLQDVMRNDGAARRLWEDWSTDSSDFVVHVRDEVAPFLDYLKQRNLKGKDDWK